MSILSMRRPGSRKYDRPPSIQKWQIPGGMPGWAMVTHRIELCNMLAS